MIKIFPLVISNWNKYWVNENLNILGRGSYAVVRLSTQKNSKEKFAIKIYEKIRINDSMKMQNVKREILLLKELDHPNVIKLHYAIEDRRSVFFSS